MTGLTTALLGIFLLSNFAAPLAAGASLGFNNTPQYTVAMTAYNAVPSQTDSDPSTTASGASSNPEVVAARSTDLADELPFGTVIEIDSSATSTLGCGLNVVKDDVGLRVIADSMHPRIKDRIDILFDSGDGKKSAKMLGLCKDITIHVVGHVDIDHMPKTQTELKLAVAQQLAIKKW